jgi:hypothetical protein
MRASGTARVGAGRPTETLPTDLHGIHDLLILGYWGVMTTGPQLKDEARKRSQDVLNPPANFANNPSNNYLTIMYANDWGAPEHEWPGLAQARSGAVALANLLPDVHPVKSCREKFGRNVAACGQDANCTDEDLVVMQAAEAWECIGFNENNIMLTCNGDKESASSCENEGPLTSLRTSNGTLKQWEPWVKPYRNYVLTGCDVGGQATCPVTGNACAGNQCCPGVPESSGKTFPCPSAEDSFDGCESDEKVESCIKPTLGACFQDGWGPDGYPAGKTKWLRACSYWTSFHSMALRADALGEDFPNQLFGAIAKIVAGGALFCGG